jgi:hypothetical protein
MTWDHDPEALLFRRLERGPAASKNRRWSSSARVSAFTARIIAARWSASWSTTMFSGSAVERTPVAGVVVREPRVHVGSTTFSDAARRLAKY